MSDRFEVMMDLIAEQAPALFVVGGVGYEGHVQSCVDGTVVAIARPVGAGKRETYRWAYEAIEDLGPADVTPAAEEGEDPMMRQARELAARAHEDRELSLAERLLRTRTEGHTNGDGDRTA